MEQQTYKSAGGRGVYPRKFFLNGFARTGKTAQNDGGGGGATCPYPGGATAHWKFKSSVKTFELISLSVKKLCFGLSGQILLFKTYLQTFMVLTNVVKLGLERF